MSQSTYYLEYGRHRARLGRYVNVAVFLRTRPRAILLAMTTIDKSIHWFCFFPIYVYRALLAMITLRKSIHRFSFLSSMSMGLRRSSAINNSLCLARKYAQIFVRRHYLFREANCFSRVKLEEKNRKCPRTNI